MEIAATVKTKYLTELLQKIEDIYIYIAFITTLERRNFQSELSFLKKYFVVSDSLAVHKCLWLSSAINAWLLMNSRPIPTHNNDNHPTKAFIDFKKVPKSNNNILGS